jgi:hypothetical protein
MSNGGGMVGGIYNPTFLYYKDFLASQAAKPSGNLK